MAIFYNFVATSGNRGQRQLPPVVSTALVLAHGVGMSYWERYLKLHELALKANSLSHKDLVEFSTGNCTDFDFTGVATTRSNKRMLHLE